MSDDDTRILNMRINNKEFLKGTGDSLKAIDTLNKGIDNAGKGPGMQNMAKSAGLVSTKFGAMKIAGVTAIATITNKAVNAGLMLAKSLTIDPILDGWREYNKLLTSTQTIQANTGKSTAVVGKYLKQLNDYSDKTIYNFGQMADNIGKFTAAGVKIDDATVAIKGMANAAALGGSTTEQLNSAMYQMSQALSTGRIKLMDWNSLVNAGMGTKSMQTSLKATAAAMGGPFKKNMEEAIKKGGSFRDSLQYGWLEADVFTEAMKVMAGTVNDAGEPIAYTVKQLRKMGYSQGAAEEMHRVSQAAIDSATEIKTFSQLIDVVKESVGSGFSQVFMALFGNLEQSKKIWTSVGKVVTGAVGQIFDGVTNMLGVWRKAGGFEKMWAGFANIFKALGNVLAPIGALFDAIFPGTEKSGTALIGLTNGFYGFTVMLERVTRGVGFLTPVFEALGTAINFVYRAIGVLVDRFDGPAIEMLKRGAEMGRNMIDGLISGLNVDGVIAVLGDKFNQMVDYVKDLLGIHSPSTVFADIGRNIVEGLVWGIESLFGLITGALKGLFGSFKDMDKFDWANAFSVIFGSAVLVMVYKFYRAISGVLGNIGGILEETKGSLQALQTGIKAKAILNIAIAVGILAASLLVLSQIPQDKLGNGLLAIGTLMGMMSLAMVGLSKAMLGFSGSIGLVAVTTALTAMAAALVILSVAVLAFGSMDWGVMMKGLTGISLSLVVLVAAMLGLAKAGPGIIFGAAALVVVATALTMLVGVITLFNALPREKLVEGLAKMAAVMVVMAVGMYALAAAGPAVIIAAAALGIMAFSLTGMLGVITLFAGVSWGTIASGVLKIAAAIIVIGLASQIGAPGLIALGIAIGLIGLGMLALGAGLALAGVGLAAIAVAGIGAGAALAAAFEAFLAILPLLAIQMTAALVAFIEAIADASPRIVAALVKIGSALLDGLSDLAPKIAATALDLLETFVKAVVDSRLIFFDAGIDLITGFLQTIRDEMPTILQLGTDIIVEFIEGIGDGAEQIVTAAGETILDFLTALNDAVILYAEPIAETGRSIGVNLIDGLIRGLVPDFIEDAFDTLVNDFVGYFKDLLGIKSPSTVFEGFGKDIVMGLVNGITGLLGSVGGAISKLGSKLKDGLNNAKGWVSDKVGDIKSAIGRLPGILTGLLGKIGTAAKSIGTKIVDKISEGLSGAKNAVKGVGTAVLKAVVSAINSILPIKVPRLRIEVKGVGFTIGGQTLIPEIPGFARGVTGFGGGSALVGENGPEIVTMGRGSNVITNENLVKFMKMVSALTRKIASGGSKNSSGGIVYTVDANFKGNPHSSGVAFAANIAAGLINGLKANQTKVNSSMAGLGTGAAKSFADTLGIKSPSTVFYEYAKFVGTGFINGLLASVSGVQTAATTMANAAADVVLATITDNQLKLEAMQAQAEAYANASKNKKLSKAQRKALAKKAKALAKEAKKQEEVTTKENEKIARDKQYERADTAGKAAMKTEDAQAQAAAASVARQKAIELSKEADLIRKKDKKRAAELDRQAQVYLDRSKVYADRAAAYAQEASDLEAQAQTESPSSGGSGPAYNQTVSAEDIARAQAVFDSYAKSLAEAQEAMSRDLGPSEVTLNQYNTSPEAISPAEAYRNGKSLVAIAARKLVPTP